VSGLPAIQVALFRGKDAEILTSHHHVTVLPRKQQNSRDLTTLCICFGIGVARLGTRDKVRSFRERQGRTRLQRRYLRQGQRGRNRCTCIAWSDVQPTSGSAMSGRCSCTCLCADQRAYSLSAISSEAAGQALDPVLRRPPCRLGTACRWWSMAVERHRTTGYVPGGAPRGRLARVR